MERVSCLRADTSSGDWSQVLMRFVIAWLGGKQAERWTHSQTTNAFVTCSIANAAQKPRDLD